MIRRAFITPPTPASKKCARAGHPDISDRFLLRCMVL